MEAQNVSKAISMHLWNMSAHGIPDDNIQGTSPASPSDPVGHMENTGPHEPSMPYQHRYESSISRHLVPPRAHTGFGPTMNPPVPQAGGHMVGGVPGGLGGMHHQQPSSSLGPNNSPLVVPQPIVKHNPGRSIKTYHCRMCDQIFDSKSDLLVHSQHIHKQDPKPYKCPTCNKCFANSSYLSQHARIHSGIKPYKCQICERRFTQLCHLQQHIRTHTGEKPYKCQHPGCGKAFSQLSNLQSHSRSHMTDKPYRCNSCYKCFVDEQSLREHIPKHSETKHLKTHICKLCGKSYTQETYLARHMTKHNVDSERSPIATKQGCIPTLNMQQGEPLDIKPQLDGNGSISNDKNQGASAFMPLPHQFAGANPLMNSTVPSTFPFSSPRLPNNSLNSPLSHMSTGSSPRYFPFEPLGSFPKRDPMDTRNQLQSNLTREGMIANSLLSLQQIKQFHSSHPVFPKSEPSSPIHKDFP